MSTTTTKLIERDDLHGLYRPMIESFARRVGCWDPSYIETIELLDWAGHTFEEICAAES